MELQQIKTSDEELRVMLESSLVLREAGRLDEAETIARGARALAPDSDVPLVILSSLAARRGDFDEALRLSEEAMRQDAESVFAQVQHAEVLLYQSKREQAETELRGIIEAAPASPHTPAARALLEAARMLEDK